MKYLLSLKSQTYQIHSNFRKIIERVKMTENNLKDSTEKDESVSTDKNEVEADLNQDKPFFAKGLFNYKDKGTQGVISLFGYELTAPAGLKNPGIVYLSFIFVNLLIFLILKSFISG